MAEPPVAEPPIGAPPSDGAARVLRAVFNLERAGGARDDEESGGGQLAVSAPLPIFGLGPPRSDSSPLSLLETARRIGWRYLVLGPQQSNVADLRDGRNSPEILRSPSLVRRLAAAGRLAEAAVKGDPDYQPRFLDARLLGWSGIWMKSRSGAKPDRFFSVREDPIEVDPERLRQALSAAAAIKAAASAKSNPETGG